MEYALHDNPIGQPRTVDCKCTQRRLTLYEALNGGRKYEMVDKCYIIIVKIKNLSKAIIMLP